ncbi:MAG: winged helix-turn-helix domain-containing protein [Ilumatobacteraceae bacterium]
MVATADPRPVRSRCRAGQGRGARCGRQRLRHQAVRDRGLLARLRVAERSIAGRRPPRTLELAGRTIDLDRRDVRAADGSPIRLTPIEWALLQHLADAEGRVVGQTELLRAVWGPSYTTETNYLRVHVTHLRKKLEHDPAHPVHLLTEPGIGYRLSC